jgi:hypothetical protein
MAPAHTPRQWQRHLVYRKQSLKTTWKLRLAILAMVILTAWLTRGFWIPSLGLSLACREELGPSDVILVENFDPNYLVFERAAALEKAGLSARVIVPTRASREHAETPNTIARGMTELMAGVARVKNLVIVPMQDIEPISLNAAYQIRDVLTTNRWTSVIVVAPAFRSRRSLLVYGAVLKPAGIQVLCTPVFGEYTHETWTATWHGIQDVTEQFVKLQFYRFYVLPLARSRSATPARTTVP